MTAAREAARVGDLVHRGVREVTPVGLEETADGVRSIYFYDVLLGRLNERTLDA
jgi:hypothetical protein